MERKVRKTRLTSFIDKYGEERGRKMFTDHQKIAAQARWKAFYRSRSR